MRPTTFMKNVLFLCASASILMTGCTASQEAAAFTPQLDSAFTVTASLEGAAPEPITLTLTRAGEGLWDAVFSEPPALAGVMLHFEGDAVSASYKGLAFTVPKTALPAKNMLLLTTSVLDKTAALDVLPCTEAEDGTWTASGESEGGSYTLTFTADGILSGFAVPSQPLMVQFFEYAAAAPPETASAGTTVTTVCETTAETTNGDTSQ